MNKPDARFGIAVDDDNGYHVRFRLFAATGGAHLGRCGQLVMRSDEFAAFRDLLAPVLADRFDPPEAAQPHLLPYSTIGSSVPDAAELARALRLFPPHSTSTNVSNLSGGDRD